LAETALEGTSNESQEYGSMKLNVILTKTSHERVVNCSANPTQRTGEPEAPARTRASERFRRLKWNEVVARGDCIADERLGLQPWEGPGGFQAGAFVRPIYRRKETEKFRPTTTPKIKA
jgi:hypothetical protein